MTDYKQGAKYTWLELAFSDKWQWVRKRSKCLWVKDPNFPGCSWVKFTDDELNAVGDRLGISDFKPEFEGAMYEDWREP